MVCARQTGVGREQVRRQENENTKKNGVAKDRRVLEKNGIGGGTHPQASAGQTGAGRGGMANEGQPRGGLASDDESRGGPMTGDESRQAQGHGREMESFGL